MVLWVPPIVPGTVSSAVSRFGSGHGGLRLNQLGLRRDLGASMMR